MRLGSIPQRETYYINKSDGDKHVIKTVQWEKDLGVVIDNKLNFERHIDVAVNKAYSMLGTIKRTFTSLTPAIFIPLYKALVRSHLEYGHEIWNPWKKGEIEKLEKVQRRATKMVTGLRNTCYEDRLRTLNMPTLAHRRLRGDLIIMYKLAHGYIKSSISVPYSTNKSLRGHPLKLETGRFNTKGRRHFLCNRVVNVWNSLPAETVMATSINSFKNNFDKYWRDSRNIYSY